jgi:hypothetical protein
MVLRSTTDDDEEMCCECPFEDDCLYIDEENSKQLKISSFRCMYKDCIHRFNPDCIRELPERLGVGDRNGKFPCRRHEPRWFTNKIFELGLLEVDETNDNNNVLNTSNEGNMVTVDLVTEETLEDVENELDVTFNSYCPDLVEAVR